MGTMCSKSDEGSDKYAKKKHFSKLPRNAHKTKASLDPPSHPQSEVSLPYPNGQSKPLKPPPCFKPEFIDCIYRPQRIMQGLCNIGNTCYMYFVILLNSYIYMV